VLLQSIATVVFFCWFGVDVALTDGMICSWFGAVLSIAFCLCLCVALAYLAIVAFVLLLMLICS
jgi:hypothetical protein